MPTEPIGKYKPLDIKGINSIRINPYGRDHKYIVSFNTKHTINLEEYFSTKTELLRWINHNITE